MLTTHSLASVAEKGRRQPSPLNMHTHRHTHSRTHTHPFKHVTRQAGWLVFGGVVCAVGLWLCFRSGRVDNTSVAFHRGEMGIQKKWL